MKRIYEPAAYAAEPGVYWHGTVTSPDWPRLSHDLRTDVAVIGGGFTGLVAALRLAQDGVGVVLLEAETPGFGASTRNGGFCCLGGSKAPHGLLRRRFGEDGAAAWYATEKAAVATVAALLQDHRIDADTHSEGETLLAHTPRAMAALRAEARTVPELYGVDPTLIEAGDMRAHGLGGPFHGALTTPIGFALNPAKYHAGLAAAAGAAGVALYAHTPVTRIDRQGATTRLCTPDGTVTADRVILATNGYSSDDLPPWLRARYLPVQSSVLMTRPLTAAEQEAQGWTSAQMAYDTRTLLHYFRKLPDGRFLFGIRGGLTATPRAQSAINRKIRADFHTMFPAWREVEVTHQWSGLVCLMANLTPFAGPVPGHPGLFGGLGYHGNGVAMGSHTGALLAALVQGKTPDGPYPPAMQAPPARFPLGRFRRSLLAPAYAAAALLDR
ncbi:NAD(P)/FAD-dependent oxidoreductase [Thalassococcus sp. BH17M4-6]|uniref:NAD(P)/FAD-dependent oxidoreductase n=1 Tax=Thalassococcus sp. BH17M4-6 TaxID=3413148 RepID=UPI003BC58648